MNKKGNNSKDLAKIGVLGFISLETNMKKLLLALLFILAFANLYAISYSPSVSVAIGGNFTKYSDDFYRPVLDIEIDANPFAVTIEDNKRLSFPFSAEYLAKSSIEGRTRLQERFRLALALRFEYLFNSHFAMSVAPSIGYTHFPLINAGSLFISLEAGPMFIFSRFISVSMPLKAIAATGEIELQASVTCTIYFLGLTKEWRK